MIVLRALLTIVLVLAVLLVCIYLYSNTKSPSHNRTWSEDQDILPEITITDGAVEVKNMRDFKYESTKEYQKNYNDISFDLSEIQTVDFFIEELSPNIGAAHTFLSFGLRDGKYIAISPEIRKEKGEVFSPIKGLFNEYEMMYVVATEEDVLKLRGIHRNNPVSRYSIDITPETAQALFRDMAARTIEIRDTPEFYNTLTNACGSTIAKHIEKLAPGSITWGLAIAAPLRSYRVAHDLGLLNDGISLEDHIDRAPISELIRAHQDKENFSESIRVF